MVELHGQGAVAEWLGLPHWVVVGLHRLETIMASVAELNAKLDELVAANAARNEAQSGALARVAEDVAFLKAQQQQGVDLTPALTRLDASIADAQAQTVALQGVDPVPENPPQA